MNGEHYIYDKYSKSHRFSHFNNNNKKKNSRKKFPFLEVENKHNTECCLITNYHRETNQVQFFGKLTLSSQLFRPH